MKRLLGLLLVMGGCSAKSVNDVKTVEWKDTVVRDGLRYEVEGMTHVTGIVISRYPTGEKERERTYKSGKPDGLPTAWEKNGQKKNGIVTL